MMLKIQLGHHINTLQFNNIIIIVHLFFVFIVILILVMYM